MCQCSALKGERGSDSPCCFFAAAEFAAMIGSTQRTKSFDENHWSTKSMSFAISRIG